MPVQKPGLALRPLLVTLTTDEALTGRNIFGAFVNFSVFVLFVPELVQAE